jgi:hypothetical protein
VSNGVAFSVKGERDAEMNWNKVGAIGSFGGFVVATLLFIAQVWPYPQWKAEHPSQPAVSISQAQPITSSPAQPAKRGTFPKSIVFFLIASLLLSSLAILGSWRKPRLTGAVEPKLRIHSALYGVGNDSDIQIGNKLDGTKREGLVLAVNNDLVNRAPEGKFRHLVVKYSWEGGEQKTISIPEHGWLMLPPDAQIQNLKSQVEVAETKLRQRESRLEQLQQQLDKTERTVAENRAAAKRTIATELDLAKASQLELQKEAEKLSDDIRGFLKSLGPRPAPTVSESQTETERLEAARRDSAAFAPWVQRLQGGWLGRLDRVEKTRHLLAEKGITDGDLDMALRSQLIDEHRILRIADRLLLLSRAEPRPLVRQ